jgi:hypothetical protein
MTIYAQLYCTTAELIEALGLSGDEPGLLGNIRSGSNSLANMVGNFIPVVETRTFYPNRFGEIAINPVLWVLTVTNDTTVVPAATSTADGYSLEPGERCYPHGPYARIKPGGTVWSSKGVHILAYWGKFEEIRLVDVDTVTQNSSALTLTLEDGSKGSAGMVILLDTEQELTGGNGDEGSPDPTIATSLLNGAIAADDEEITVDNGAEFHRGEVIRLGTEDCIIRRIVGNIMVVRRGWNGTTKAAHADDLAMYVYRTFAVERGVNGTSGMAHSNEAVYRFTVPDEVNELAKELSGLRRMKEKVGYASKSGNAELGETFYYNVFPNEINKIRANYKVH